MHACKHDTGILTGAILGSCSLELSSQNGDASMLMLILISKSYKCVTRRCNELDRRCNRSCHSAAISTSARSKGSLDRKIPLCVFLQPQRQANANPTGEKGDLRMTGWYALTDLVTCRKRWVSSSTAAYLRFSIASAVSTCYQQLPLQQFCRHLCAQTIHQRLVQNTFLHEL